MSTKRKASWASTCPVTRSSHEWLTLTQYGSPSPASYCRMCLATWIGVEEEWERWEQEKRIYGPCEMKEGVFDGKE